MRRLRERESESEKERVQLLSSFNSCSVEKITHFILSEINEKHPIQIPL